MRPRKHSSIVNRIRKGKSYLTSPGVKMSKRAARKEFINHIREVNAQPKQYRPNQSVSSYFKQH